MSNETLPDNQENTPEKVEIPEPIVERQPAQPEAKPLDVERIRSEVADAEPLERAPLKEERPVESGETLPPPNAQLKAQTLHLTLKETRKKLSGSQKVLSKVIHQPQVDTISNVTGKTIARPSGMLFGGLFALIGSALYLYASYHYHFTYKYIAFSIFFVGGFIIGLIIEFITKLTRKNKVS